MKKILIIILCLTFLTTPITSYGENSIQTSKLIQDPNFSKTIPYRMKPGTILIYDDNLNPKVIEGGFVENSYIVTRVDTLDYPRVVEISNEMTENEIKQVELENNILLDAYHNGTKIFVPAPKIYKNMMVIYDDNSGEINNIYYSDESEPSGYSLNNRPAEVNNALIDIKEAINSGQSVTWVWGSSNNTLTYQPLDDSFLGTGRATYFTDSIGNRNNILKNKDVATQMDYDYSRIGDKDVEIRNLDTDVKKTYYQADVGSLPNAIIDIWGLNNLHDLAGETGVTSIPNVRYYHKRFSDQNIPS